jgi:hypothetical protein
MISFILLDNFFYTLVFYKAYLCIIILKINSMLIFLEYLYFKAYCNLIYE